MNFDITGGSYMSGGENFSENVKLCMRSTQTDQSNAFRYNRLKSKSFSLPKANIPFANRSTSGYTGLGPFEPLKAAGIPNYCSMKDPCLDDYFARKFTRMLTPNLPLRAEMQRASMDADRMGLRSAGYRSSCYLADRTDVLYKVAVTTADVKGAGTAVPVYITIRGDKGNLLRTRLKKIGKSKKAKEKLKEVVKLNPGSTNIFPIRCSDLGNIESIIMEHDGIEPKDSWLLQGVEIMNTQNKKIWLFTCNHWLSLYKEDGRVSRELFGQKSMRTKYDIMVVTGSLPNAGTNSNVFIALFGRTGVSPQIPLDNPVLPPGVSTAPCFQSGQSNRFIVSATCVGPITKIRICHDESGGPNNGWYLDRVVVTDMKHPEWRYFFCCKNWLSKQQGDGAIAREIRGTREISMISSRTTYKISVYTGDKSGAGTHANVFIKLYGSNGESNIIGLETDQSGGLKQNSVFEQIVPTNQLGFLEKIKIGHDGFGPQSRWYCEKVIINDMEMSRVFEFPCGQWLSDNYGETLVQELSVKKAKDQYSSYKYQLHITTGNRNKASTTSKVYVSMIGPEENNEMSDIQPRNRKLVNGSSTTTDMKPSVNNSGRILISKALFERGRTDVVEVDLPQLLSPLTSMLVAITPSGKKPDWFLDDIVVCCPTTGVEQSFLCGKWLSGSMEGAETEVTLVEDINKRKIKEMKEGWLIKVFTSNINGASTSAKITMVLYSRDRKTEDIILDSREKISQGSVLESKVDIIPVGVPYKLRVQHDNSGSNPSWHLDKVTFTRIASNEEYTFFCDKWLSDSHDDGSIVREIAAEGPGILDVAQVKFYRVQIYTGNKKYAGTNANVFLNIFGLLCDTGQRWLTKSLNNSSMFAKGQLDEFAIEAIDLGDIYKIVLGHDSKNPGSGWFVDKVLVTQVDNPANSMTFRCQCWFDTQEGDGLIVRELTGAALLGNVTYEVHVKTGTDMGAGTDANVFITIFGSLGDTGERQLKASDSAINKFESGRIDTFKIESENLGEIKSMKLSQDNSGAGAAWKVEYVNIIVREAGVKYIFQIHDWLNKQRSFIEKDPSSIEKIDRGVPYQITIYTEDIAQAGTDANVFIQIYGKNKKTEEIPLLSRTNTFERGAEDIFKITATDVGRIEKIRIGHDGKGAGAGWFLNKVLIEKLVASPTRQDNVPSRPSSALKSGRSSQSISSGFSMSSDDSRDMALTEIPRKSISIRPGVEEEMEIYWFFCNRWLASDEGDKMLVVELLPVDEQGRPLSELREVTYTLDVKTGTLRGAGTDANVFITLYGKNGDSGERKLKETIEKTINKFEEGNLDVFEIKAIDLAQLERIKIRHDNKGGGAAWYLEYVLVCDDANNEYLFPCFKWLAKNMEDGLISRDIFVASADNLQKWRQGKLTDEDFKIQQEHKMETYEIKVYTSKKKFAGTDANVDVILFGESNDSGILPLKKSLTHSNKFESGNCDEFIVKLASLGDLTKLKIQQDGSGGNSDWHLEKVDVTASKAGKTWIFPCHEWLSKSRGEAKLFRVLYPQAGITKSHRPKISYEVCTYTSDVSGADTNANVYIQIYGRDDETEKKILSTVNDRGSNFKRGAMDIFHVEMEDVADPIKKIRIGHDGTGLRSGWHLEKVTVKRLFDDGKNAITYVFPCRRWLARDEDDRAIERELLPERIVKNEEINGRVVEKEEEYAGPNRKKTYKIHVETGSETGTDSNVFMKVYGDNGDTGERQLKNSETHRDKFEKNNVDVFNWEAIDIGRIYRIDVRHDNSALFKKSWFLKKVEVEDMMDNERYTFHCEKWLSSTKEDRKISRTFYVIGYEGEKVLTYGSKSRSVYSSSSPGSMDFSVESTKYSFEDEDDINLETIPYTITVTTGPKPNMGSSGPIWVCFYGPNNRKTRRIPLKTLNDGYFAPSSKEIISVEAGDVESIREIEVCNVGSSRDSGWYLENIKVEMPTKGRSYRVKAGAWLSQFDGDRAMTRKFRIDEQTLKKFVPKVTYNISVVTGDAESGGTSSTLFLQLFGVGEKSAEYPLEKLENRFERASKDQFKMEMENVGTIKKIRIHNDGKGVRPHWFLERIEITNEETDEKFSFEYNDYLSDTLGQKKQLTVDLAPTGDEKYSSYLIRVKTSDIRNGGTSANVFVKLVGEFSDSTNINLKQLVNRNEGKKPFQKGETDEFEMTNVLSLGELYRCQVWHDNTGGFTEGNKKWHLEWIEVQELKTPSVWKFQCGKWLSMTEDDKQLHRELMCDAAPRSKTRGLRNKSAFSLKINTGNKQNSGMVHNVWIKFRGTLQQSEIFQYPNDGKLFSKGKSDVIDRVEFLNIGELKELVLGAYVNPRFRDNDRRRWFCNDIQAKDLNSLTTYIFEINKWIPINDNIDEYNDGVVIPVSKVIEDASRKKLEEKKQAKVINYEILVVTGDAAFAGTNANVFLTIYGEHGDSGRRPLVQKNRDLFERKQQDRFVLECFDLGRLLRVKVEHDNSGISSDWLLDKIEIKNMSSGAISMFPCQSWLSATKGDGKLWKILESE